jgi:hypothetical protein
VPHEKFGNRAGVRLGIDFIFTGLILIFVILHYKKIIKPVDRENRVFETFPATAVFSTS